MSRDEGCESCSHPFDPHVLCALEFAEMAGVPDVPVSGLVLCPACDCCMTWSVPGWPPPEIPPQREINLLREAVL